MKKRGDSNKRGQVTIFIIIAIIVVAAVVFFFMFRPNIISTTTQQQNPSSFIQSCLEDEIGIVVDTLSSRGGSVNPEHTFLYQGEELEYLCYTNQFYKTCIVQQPLLKRHIEEEIFEEIKDNVNICLNELKTNYQSRGYEVGLSGGDFSIELLPKRIATRINSTLVLTKDSTERFDSFSVVLNNNLYELISIANSIVEWEAEYGDAETTLYMDYYRDLKVEKYKQDDGTTIYIITDRNTGNKFQFASRSVAWPSGYGVQLT